MQISFYKYHGTGNDFILIDNRTRRYDGIFTTKIIAEFCHRRFGIGADGLILLETSDQADFKMVYYNADGRESTMCGNGGRCIVHFAHFLKIFDNQTRFEAIDGLHHASITDQGLISLGMNDVLDIQEISPQTFVLDTGSPHYVSFLDQMPEQIRDAGRSIRYSPNFKEAGINVNFVVKEESTIQVCTYERGVEDETYSCGTGVVAAALSSALSSNSGTHYVEIVTKGGYLQVAFDKSSDDSFRNIRLIGPAIQVFQGTISSNP
ncbi:MAG: diaminopimelate epimerase [Chitinophagales bacterium]|nr:diaminopimelate epimerase [Chitinophagales bacterium]